MSIKDVTGRRRLGHFELAYDPETDTTFQVKSGTGGTRRLQATGPNVQGDGLFESDGAPLFGTSVTKEVTYEAMAQGAVTPPVIDVPMVDFRPVWPKKVKLG